jgi:hypothetical protein
LFYLKLTEYRNIELLKTNEELRLSLSKERKLSQERKDEMERLYKDLQRRSQHRQQEKSMLNSRKEQPEKVADRILTGKQKLRNRQKLPEKMPPLQRNEKDPVRKRKHQDISAEAKANGTAKQCETLKEIPILDISQGAQLLPIPGELGHPIEIAGEDPPPFSNCSLLSVDQQSQICEWLESEGKSKTDWKLAWRGSRDGFDKFHSLCDLIGESVTVIKSSKGYLFGGFSSASWDAVNKNEQYESAPGSFLFTISNPHGIPPTKYPLKFPEYTIYHNKQHGVIFGQRDIFVTSDCNKHSNSCTSFPMAYADTTGKKPVYTFTGSLCFRVRDIEVFTH